MIATDARQIQFERCVTPLLDQLHRAAHRYTGNTPDADELVQNTLLKAWRSFESFSTGTNLRAWLFRIMTNTWITAHRASQRRPIESLVDDYTAEQLATEALPSAENQMLAAWADDEVAHAMLALPTSLRVPLYYADVEDLKYREIAEILRIPVGTVMSRLHRGRKLIRVALREFAHRRGYGIDADTGATRLDDVA